MTRVLPLLDQSEGGVLELCDSHVPSQPARGAAASARAAAALDLSGCRDTWHNRTVACPAPSYSGLVRRPLTAVTRVRIPLGSPTRKCPSEGRAFRVNAAAGVRIRPLWLGHLRQQVRGALRSAHLVLRGIRFDVVATSRGLAVGWVCSTSAAMPATCGDAIDVPEIVFVPPPSHVGRDVDARGEQVDAAAVVRERRARVRARRGGDSERRGGRCGREVARREAVVAGGDGEGHTLVCQIASRRC